jgi:hypothetical protein
MNKAECAGSSQCPLDKRKISLLKFLAFRCRSHECVGEITECKRPFSSYASLQIDLTLDPLTNSMVTFAYSNTGEPIGRLELISNSIL